MLNEPTSGLSVVLENKTNNTKTLDTPVQAYAQNLFQIQANRIA